MAGLAPPPTIIPLTLSALPSFRLRSPSLNAVRLRRVFDLFDRNGDGEISITELRQALERLGLGAADPADLEVAVAPYVRPGRSGIGYDDFEAFHRGMADALFGGDDGRAEEAAEEEEEEMREAFMVFDEDGDGFISAKELQAVLERLGLPEGKNLAGVRQMIDAVDRDRDGVVNFEEFKYMMKTIEIKANA